MTRAADAAHADTAYIVFDTESVVDGALLARSLYPDLRLSPEAAVLHFQKEQAGEADPESVFVPVAFHVPVAIAVARVRPDLRLADVSSLDAPRFDPREMVELFWKGVQFYDRSVLVDFNGRGFDIPLLTLSAFRFGISAPRYFDDQDRFGFRYRFTPKHLDLLEWITEYGAYRLRGGLNLLAKILGKPGKMGVSGSRVAELHAAGKIQEINDYCLHDALDTYFVFLRTRVLAGKISLDEEQHIVKETETWLESRVEKCPALRVYLENFGHWDPRPFL
ncbi:MAG: 3'-5' exonuclease [Planctomycetes bacterium]|nr:3'-5' exonuclease [Planctomycetota bacterium]